MTPTVSAFDSEIYGLRIGWASAPDFDGTGFDLVFLRGPYPAPLHPQATLLDARLDLLAAPRRVAPSEIRRAEDEAACAFAEQLGATAFTTHSRYFLDGRLAPKAPEVYRRWVRAAYGRGDLYILPGSGFFSVSRKDDVLRLDLIAVLPDRRRNGVGSDLIRAFLSLPGEGERRVKVEAGNVFAINFYFTNGFAVAAAESVQHLWLRDS